MKQLEDMLSPERLERLKVVCDTLSDRTEFRDRWEVFEPLLTEITPLELVSLVDYIMAQEADISSVKLQVSRLIHACSKFLERDELRFDSIPYVSGILQENRQIESVLAALKGELRLLQGEADDSRRMEVVGQLSALSQQLKAHYEKLENDVFPILEKEVSEHACTSLMWSIHTDAAAALAQCIEALQEEGDSLRRFNEQVGKFFFAAGTIIFRENAILLPAMVELLPASVWEQLASYEADERLISDQPSPAGSIDLPTGTLSREQLVNIFSNLPVDITLVDAEDRVVFYNTPPERIFPRTPAVIGRKVQQCHPPKSVGTVERILDGFRRLEHDRASFRVTVGEKYLLINYIALYDADGVYDGVLEILQEISGLQKLSGERRLLDWEG